MPAIRARLTGNTVTSRHAPSAPSRYSPTTDIVISNGIRNNATTLVNDDDRPPGRAVAAVAPNDRGSKLAR